MTEVIIYVLLIVMAAIIFAIYLVGENYNNDELEQNIKDFETRTGGLHSDYKYGKAHNKKNIKK